MVRMLEERPLRVRGKDRHRSLRAVTFNQVVRTAHLQRATFG